MVDVQDLSLSLGAESSEIGQWQLDRVFDLLLREAPHHDLQTENYNDLASLLEALRSGAIDLVACSAADLTQDLPDGLVISAWLPRGQVEDVLLGCSSLDTLPNGGVVIASGPLRRAQILERCPGAIVEDSGHGLTDDFARLDAGSVAAVIVPRWELMALCEAHRPSTILDPTVFFPSPGQGITVTLTRSAAADHLRLTQGMNHAITALAGEAERAAAAEASELIGIVSSFTGDELSLTVKRLAT